MTAPSAEGMSPLRRRGGGRRPSASFPIAPATPSGAYPVFVWSPMLDGRGGSVSRRDLDQLTGNHAQLAWGRNCGGTDKPIPSYSSGGGPGEALLLEKRPPPEFRHSSRWQVAAALSAAVTSTNLQGIAPNSHGGATAEKRTSLFPAALREGARGRGFSQRSRLPRIPPKQPPASLREGVRGRVLLYREALYPASTH